MLLHDTRVRTRPRLRAEDRRLWSAWECGGFGSIRLDLIRRGRVGQGKRYGGHRDVVYQQARIASDFIEPYGQVVRVHRAKCKRVARSGVLRGEGDRGAARQDVVHAELTRRLQPQQIDAPIAEPDRDEVIQDGIRRPCKALQEYASRSQAVSERDRARAARGEPSCTAGRAGW